MQERHSQRSTSELRTFRAHYHDPNYSVNQTHSNITDFQSKTVKIKQKRPGHINQKFLTENAIIL